MVNPTLKTSADDLYELVRNKKKISIEEASKELGLPESTVHSLVDFLVEEKLFGIEYKFTTPFIYLNDSNKKHKIIETPKSMLSKEDFFSKAEKKNIPFQKINELWTKYMDENLSLIKVEFIRKCKLRNVPEEKIGKLWSSYVSYLK